MRYLEAAPETPISLLEYPVFPFSDAQLSKFDKTSISAEYVMDFDPAEALEHLKSDELQEKELVFAVDIGGDTVAGGLAYLSNGELVFPDRYRTEFKSTDGVGYLEALEKISLFAKEYDIPVGVSYAGPIEGTKPTDGQNVKKFLEELDDKYAGDFAELFPSLAVLQNDAVAGLISGAVQAKKVNKDISNVIYVINGSGIGGAVLDGKQNKIYATEPGHVEVVKELNPENFPEPCRMKGDFTCIEKVAASKAGIERIWELLNGERLTGRELEALYLSGNRLVANLYDDSATLTAHISQGMARAFNFSISSKKTVVVGHGGAFKFPNFGARMKQIVNANTRKSSQLIMTKDYSHNACLDGAAIAALLTRPADTRAS